ncbi:hypothetical protein PVL29_008812 [Vitis rotundifolia]|uniref:Uncharacterized protein n=1 Tax=Vitis rotundifolia TaxID=103349 RepID=A0AA38ZXC6_VITRO|nr:hypothetical protein PVL29_008812 [Vitis rotundifolia]
MPESKKPELDPLLKDLSEKKQIFRRNVVSLAAELKDARARLTLQQESCTRETLTRQVVEKRTRSMEDEICQLQKTLEERNCQLEAFGSDANRFLKELDDIRLQLSGTQATADISARSAQSAQLQCLALAKELNVKNSALKEHEDRANRLAEQLNMLHIDLEAREASQKQLKDEVLRIEKDIMQAVSRAEKGKNCELMKILDEVSPKNFEKIGGFLTMKDEEIGRLRDDIRVLSAHWERKTKELESQLEKNRRADQDLKKRVLKLEFCLQEARSQTRKLQRVLSHEPLIIYIHTYIYIYIYIHPHTHIPRSVNQI